VYQVQADFRGKTMPFTYTVTEFEANRRIVLDGVGEKATSLDTIAFEPQGDGGTRITYTADFKLKGVLRVAEPFLGGTFRTLARKALDGLAAELGAGATAPDGA
jgi:carbon monoxide dehydrogenase subunit G